MSHKAYYVNLGGRPAHGLRAGRLAVEYYGSDILRIEADRIGYLQAAIGIGVGSFVAGYLSGGKIEYGLIPMGAAGMTAFSLLFSRGPSFEAAALLLRRSVSRADFSTSPSWRSFNIVRIRKEKAE